MSENAVMRLMVHTTTLAVESVRVSSRTVMPFTA